MMQFSDAWWHSPQMIGVLWAVIAFLLGSVGYYNREWRKDRKTWEQDRAMIRELQQKIEELHNGTTIAEIRTRQEMIYSWWKEHMRKIEEK